MPQPSVVPPGTRPSIPRPLRAIVLAALLAAAAGCATPPPASDAAATAEFRELNDPIEPFNRGVFQFNRGVDAMFLKPMAEFYMLLTPPPLQSGVHNFLANLSSPVILINDLLQAEFTRAGTTLGRFVVNTMIGFLGFADPAKSLGLERHDEDFGQTLAVWGSPEGPYLVLPVLGPSNPRDATGAAVDSAVFSPFGLLRPLVFGGNYPVINYSQAGLTAIDTRASLYDELNDIEKNSLDPYAAFRSLYRQNRRAEILNGRQAPDEGGPTLDYQDIPTP